MFVAGIAGMMLQRTMVFRIASFSSISVSDRDVSTWMGKEAKGLIAQKKNPTLEGSEPYIAISLYNAGMIYGKTVNALSILSVPYPLLVPRTSIDN